MNPIELLQEELDTIKKLDEINKKLQLKNVEDLSPKIEMYERYIKILIKYHKSVKEKQKSMLIEVMKKDENDDLYKT